MAPSRLSAPHLGPQHPPEREDNGAGLVLLAREVQIPELGGIPSRKVGSRTGPALGTLPGSALRSIP